MSDIDFFDRCLQKMFKGPAIVRVTQTEGWKKGKTNFGLFLDERLEKLDIIDESAATNIDTFGELPYIHDLVNLKRWLYRDKSQKAYIYDEVNKHNPNRRAMTRQNINTINLFPELSKAHARLIVIAQDFGLADPDFSNPAWVRGTFEKHTIKDVVLYADFVRPPQTFHHVPATHIRYDPDGIAPFTEEPDEIIVDDKEYDILVKWANGTTGKALGYGNTLTVNRLIRKSIRRLWNERNQLKELLMMKKIEVEPEKEVAVVDG